MTVHTGVASHDQGWHNGTFQRFVSGSRALSSVSLCHLYFSEKVPG
jgi:hypothetical protein